jgi:hypothetical protein
MLDDELDLLAADPPYYHDLPKFTDKSSNISKPTWVVPFKGILSDAHRSLKGA